MEVHAEPVTESLPWSFDDTFRLLYPTVVRTAGFVARDAQMGSDIAQERSSGCTSGGIG